MHLVGVTEIDRKVSVVTQDADEKNGHDLLNDCSFLINPLSKQYVHPLNDVPVVIPKVGKKLSSNY